MDIDQGHEKQHIKAMNHVKSQNFQVVESKDLKNSSNIEYVMYQLNLGNTLGTT